MADVTKTRRTANRGDRGKAFRDSQIGEMKRLAAENPKGRVMVTKESIAENCILLQHAESIDALMHGLRTAVERIKKHNAVDMNEGGVAQIEMKDLEELLEREEGKGTRRS